MKRITQAKLETARAAVRQHCPAYEEEQGVGPCGPLAILMARAGWGQLAQCDSRPHGSKDEYAWYPHYIVLRAGKVVDISGEYLFGSVPEYRAIETITEKDIIGFGPGFIYGQSDVDFWAARMQGVL